MAEAESNEVVTAEINSPYSGSFNFSGDVLATSSGSDSPAASSGSSSGSYDFLTNTAVILSLSYMTPQGDPFLSVGEIDLIDVNNDTTTTDYLGYGLGAKSYSLAAGFYSFSVIDYGSDDSVNQDGFGSEFDRQNDAFSFSISAAPEPSAWALMIAGVSVAGLALRRRRPGTALAAG